MKREKLPQIDSIEELAHFWDTHDLTTFEDDLEEVVEPVFEEKRPSRFGCCQKKRRPSKGWLRLVVFLMWT